MRDTHIRPATAAEEALIADAEDELLEIQRDFTADLELLGITEDKAEAYQRKRNAGRVAGYMHSMTPAQRDEFMQRVALALEEQDGQQHD
jgi:hypothetical protein